MEFHRHSEEEHNDFSAASRGLESEEVRPYVQVPILRMEPRRMGTLYIALDDDGLDACIVQGFEIFL